MSGSTPETETPAETIARMAEEFNAREKASRGGKRPSAPDIVARAAMMLGGPGRLAAWAVNDTKYEEKFWTALFTKLMPSPGAGAGDDKAAVSIAGEIEAARKRARESHAIDDLADDDGERA